jgi:hypothetical protein
MATRRLLQYPDAEDQEKALVIRLDVRHAGDAGFCIPEFRMAIRQLVEPGESMMRREKKRYRNRG